ncbi:hypothetical protein CsatB_013322 [Cannabis sativa]
MLDCNKFGWKANDAAETIKGNMFSFGCILFFIITNGRHPFGDDSYSRQCNIEHNNMVNENILINFPEALDLISRLLSVNPLDRIVLISYQDLIGVRNRNDLYDNYFTIIFPKLFMKVYEAIYIYCRGEEDFEEYFEDNNQEDFNILLLYQNKIE